MAPIRESSTAEAVCPSCIRLSWPPRDGRRWRIERSLPDGSWRDLGTTLPGAGSFESIGLMAETAYRHRMRDADATGTPESWIELPAATTPARPASVTGSVLVPPDERWARNGEGDLIALLDGTLLHVFGRWPTSDDHSGGACIAVMRSTDDGLRWSEPSLLLAEAGHDLFHASLVRLGGPRIGLSYTKRRTGAAYHQVGEKMFRRSEDDGVTWGEEIRISDGGWRHYQSSRCGVMRRTRSGRLVHPVQRYLVQGKDAERDPEGGIGTHLFVSDDDGASWRRTTTDPLCVPGSPRVFHEACCIEYAPGRLLTLGRNPTGRLWESRSLDDGESWSTPVATGIPSTVAPAQLLRIPGSDEILLIWCPVTGGDRDLSPRHILAAQRSADGGRSWFGYRELVNAAVPGKAPYCGFAYAAGTFAESGLHLVYLDLFATAKCFMPRYMLIDTRWLLATRQPARAAGIASA